MEMLSFVVEELLYTNQNHVFFVLFYWDLFVQLFLHLLSMNIVLLGHHSCLQYWIL